MVIRYMYFVYPDPFVFHSTDQARIPQKSSRFRIGIISNRLGILTWELSSIVLEIPSDAYTTLSQDLIGYSTLNQEYCKLIDGY